MTTISTRSQLPDLSRQSLSPAQVAPKEDTPSLTDRTGFTGSDPLLESPSGTLLAKNGRRSLATIALEKTSSAIATLNPNLTLRSVPSSGSLSSKQSSKHSRAGTNSTTGSSTSSPTSLDPRASSENLIPPPEPQPSRPSHHRGSSISQFPGFPRRNTIQLLSRSPTPSGPASLFEDSVFLRPVSKMHQTSSRLLRMTEDERPFTKVSWLP